MKQPDEHQSFESSRLTIEQIDQWCDELESRWADGETPDFEEYLPNEDLRIYPIALRELIKVELDCRARLGHPRLPLVHYLERFQDWERLIRDVYEDFCRTRVGRTTFGRQPPTRHWLAVCEIAEQVAGSKSMMVDRSGHDWSSSQANVSRQVLLPEEGDRPRPDSEELERKYLRLLHQRLGQPGRPFQPTRALPSQFGGYRLERIAGQGGMGVVYEALQDATERRVAVKLIREDRLQRNEEKSDTALRRFQQESRVAAGIEHAHWVTVYEVGEFKGQPFYSMQFVEGESLADKVRTDPLATERAARYLEPVCRALAEAHRKGIIHRDIKPHNLLVEQSTDNALLTDFGLAKWVDGANEATQTGEVFGSPSYLSPEQATDASRCDERSDVYSIGATLYHLITGRPPFQAASTGRVLRQVLEKDPIEPRKLNPEIDRDLETISLKCLAKEPSHRYQSADDLADELSRYLEGRPIHARPIGRVHRCWRWSKRHPLTAILTTAIAILLLTIGVGGAVTWWITDEALTQQTIALRKEQASKQAHANTIVEFVETVSLEPMLIDRRMQPLREAILDQSVDRLLAILVNPSTTESQRLQIASVLNQIATIHLETGKLTEASDAATAADEAIQSLDDSSHPAAQAIVIAARLQLAEIEWEGGKANAAAERLESLLEFIPEANLDRTDIVEQQIKAATLAIRVDLTRSEIETANSRIGNVQSLIDQLHSQEPQPTLLQRMIVANSLEACTQVSLHLGDPSRALEFAQAAVDAWGEEGMNQLQQLRHGDNDESLNEKVISDFTRHKLALAGAIWSNRRQSEAVAIANRILPALETLSQLRPNDIGIQRNFVKCLLFVTQARQRYSEVPTLKSENYLSERLDQLNALLSSNRRSHRILIGELSFDVASTHQIQGDYQKAQAIAVVGLERVNFDSKVHSSDQQLLSVWASLRATVARQLQLSGEYSEAHSIIEETCVSLLSNCELDRAIPTLTEQVIDSVYLRFQLRSKVAPNLVDFDTIVDLLREARTRKVVGLGTEIRYHYFAIEKLLEEHDLNLDETIRQILILNESLTNISSEFPSLSIGIEVARQRLRIGTLLARSGDHSTARIVLDSGIQVVSQLIERFSWSGEAHAIDGDLRSVLAAIEIAQNDFEAALSLYVSASISYRNLFEVHRSSETLEIGYIQRWLVAGIFLNRLSHRLEKINEIEWDYDALLNVIAQKGSVESIENEIGRLLASFGEETTKTLIARGEIDRAFSFMSRLSGFEIDLLKYDSVARSMNSITIRYAARKIQNEVTESCGTVCRHLTVLSKALTMRIVLAFSDD